MYELCSRETEQVNGGAYFQDLVSVAKEGLSRQEISFGITLISVGLLLGSFLPKYAGPVLAVVLPAGWYFYDTKYN